MTNAIYSAAAATAPSYDGGPRYISLADTAKLVRAALAANFPGTKFYVRSDSYSGGASIDVWYDGVVDSSWTRIDSDDKPYGDVVTDYGLVDFTDGRWAAVRKPGAPAKRDVEAVVGAFGSRRFDGMIDMAYDVKSWLSPDGSASLGVNRGSVGSMGVDPGYDFPAPDADAILVHFGTSYVFVNDTLPYDVRTKGAA